MDILEAISPLDGRYQEKIKKLTPYFSEMALMRYRLMVEVEYFLALGEEKKIPELPPISVKQKNQLRSWYTHFSLVDAKQVKKIELITNHDVKAIEYFFKKKLEKTSLKKYSELIHFALTSEDINNLAYSLMWQGAVHDVYLPTLTEVREKLFTFAKKYQSLPMLALTHGQSATPTTMGKEFLVFATRLERQINQLKRHTLLGKLGGATGTWSAHILAYPDVSWLQFSKKFISSLGLEPNLVTTQIEPHDSLAESFHILERINTILLDFTKDTWLYISRGILGQKKKEGEVGSSTMPHKINPIHFENAEGNLGIANMYLTYLAQKLPVSRMQRDLTDSTVLRNQGVPLAHSLLACKNILTGMSRLTVNKEKLDQELNDNIEILAEAIQTILRKVGHRNPYEKLKELTRGHKITREKLKTFIQNLDIPINEKNKLLRLTPQTYTGLASKLDIRT